MRGQLRQFGGLGQPISLWATRLGDMQGEAKKGANHVGTMGTGGSGAKIK